MNDVRKRRRQRRRAKAEAQHRANARQVGQGTTGDPRIQIHYLFIDAMHALMGRSPSAARIGVVFGGVVLVLTILSLLLGLFGG